MAKSKGPRPVVKDVRSPVLTAAGIERFGTEAAVEGVRLAKLAAVRDVLQHAERAELTSVSSWLQAVLAGASPDDVVSLRGALLHEDDVVFGTPPMRADDDLVDDWLTSVYPYKNLMSRNAYEQQKYQLQVELLKLQAWVK